MYSRYEQRLNAFIDNGQADLLCSGGVGLEKECLRVSPDGTISQKPHPAVLGSALMNPYITTDYSEALLEFITPPFENISEPLAFLRDTQQFVYANLDEELLWATSMPCVVAGETSIPIAKYGSSNLGQMKTVYRRGLGHRYGRTMQVIAGVHFNYSFQQALWPLFQQLEQQHGDLQHFISTRYFDVLRNLQRFGWLIPYLFGASPAVCKSFLNGQQTKLEEFDNNTYYERYATSLRLGEIGYRNSREKEVGIKANYNSIDEYIDSLTCAIETPYRGYEDIPMVINNAYQQLNTNILQIENEYYSTVRPKQLLEGNEKPTLALRDRGVRYIELRSLDVNAFDPLGINEHQLRFLEVFIAFCLLHDSPPISNEERRGIDANLLTVAHRGREPGLNLIQNGRERELRHWAYELLHQMQPICDIMDQRHTNTPCHDAFVKQLLKIDNPDNTPSARMLEQMRENGEGFYHFAKRMSEQHHQYFNDLPVVPERQTMFKQAAEISLQKQAQIESQDKRPFDEFLRDYFAQH